VYSKILQLVLARPLDGTGLGLNSAGHFTATRPEAMATIHDQLQSYRSELATAQSKGDQAIARKLEQRIQDLEAYQQRHPEAAEAPSPLEVFCDLNPSNINCRVYDD
jgi:hypothetical protein